MTDERSTWLHVGPFPGQRREVIASVAEGLITLDGAAGILDSDPVAVAAEVAAMLADQIDRDGAWDWTDGSDHDPCDRLAVVECDGIWWLVYRGTEPDSAQRHESEAAARAALRDRVD